MMNLLKRLWNGLVQKTATAEIEPTPVEVEEEADIEQLFLEACAAIGVGSKITNSTNAVEKFVNWYDGGANKESVLDSLPAFIETDNAVKAKFQGYLK